MHSSDYVTIQILNGRGSLPAEFENKLLGIQIAGLPVRIKRVGKRPIPGGPPIGIVITLPASNFRQFGKSGNEFFDMIAEFYQINDSVCNCSICATSDNNKFAKQTHIAVTGLESGNVKKCLQALPGAVDAL